MMTKNSRRHAKSTLDATFARANHQWEKGRLKSAFRLFLAAAKGGDAGAQVNLGFFYDTGIGVKPNRASAIHWYTKAYRRGSPQGAGNLGTIWRDQDEDAQALLWFRRAVKMGDLDYMPEIAKILLQRGEEKLAISQLRKTLRAKRGEITESTRDEAARLLRQIGLRATRSRSK